MLSLVIPQPTLKVVPSRTNRENPAPGAAPKVASGLADNGRTLVTHNSF